MLSTAGGGAAVMGSKAVLTQLRTAPALHTLHPPCQLGTLQLISRMPRACLEVLKRPREMELQGHWKPTREHADSSGSTYVQRMD